MNIDLIFGDKKCTNCSSEEVFIVQLRKNKSSSKSIYFCKSCERRFTLDDGFKRFRHTPFVIKSAIRLLEDGQSFGQVANSLDQNFDIRVSRKTILDWKKKFLN